MKGAMRSCTGGGVHAAAAHAERVPPEVPHLRPAHQGGELHARGAAPALLPALRPRARPGRVRGRAAQLPRAARQAQCAVRGAAPAVTRDFCCRVTLCCMAKWWWHSISQLLGKMSGCHASINPSRREASYRASLHEKRFLHVSAVPDQAPAQPGGASGRCGIAGIPATAGVGCSSLRGRALQPGALPGHSAGHPSRVPAGACRAACCLAPSRQRCGRPPWLELT